MGPSNSGKSVPSLPLSEVFFQQEQLAAPASAGSYVLSSWAEKEEKRVKLAWLDETDLTSGSWDFESQRSYFAGNPITISCPKNVYASDVKKQFRALTTGSSEKLDFTGGAAEHKSHLDSRLIFFVLTHVFPKNAKTPYPKCLSCCAQSLLLGDLPGLSSSVSPTVGSISTAASSAARTSSSGSCSNSSHPASSSTSSRVGSPPTTENPTSNTPITPASSPIRVAKKRRLDEKWTRLEQLMSWRKDNVISEEMFRKLKSDFIDEI